MFRAVTFILWNLAQTGSEVFKVGYCQKLWSAFPSKYRDRVLTRVSSKRFQDWERRANSISYFAQLCRKGNPYCKSLRILLVTPAILSHWCKMTWIIFNDPVCKRKLTGRPIQSFAKNRLIQNLLKAWTILQCKTFLV